MWWPLGGIHYGFFLYINNYIYFIINRKPGNYEAHRNSDSRGERLDWNTLCMCGKDSLLKTRVVTHLGASDTGQYVHSKRFRS